MEKSNQQIIAEQQVLLRIPKDKTRPVNLKDLVAYTGFTARRVKQIITELRKEYPICAKETDGGGYWIAQDEGDIMDFIYMIDARLRGYEDTIKTMRKHLHNGVRV